MPSSGLLQPLSSVDAPEVDLLAEAWIEQSISDERLRVKLGQIDVATEFTSLPAAANVMAAPAGAAPTQPVLPTYPFAALGALGAVRLGEAGYLSAGVFGESVRHLDDGVFPSPFQIAEFGMERSVVGQNVRVFTGAWNKRGTFTRLDGADERTFRGWYTGGQTRLWAELDAKGELRAAATAFVQFGHTDPHLAEAKDHLAFGFHWLGWLPFRRQDTTGFYVSRVLTSRIAGSPLDADETLVEVSHRFAVHSRWSVTPVWQRVHHPGGTRSAQPVTFASVRLNLSL